MHRTSPIINKDDKPTSKLCPSCKKNKPINKFYIKKKSGKPSSYCKVCNSKKCHKRLTKFKIMAIEYKGGSCKKCGYKKYHGALEFHHRNPEQKDFSIDSVKTRKFDEKIKSELDKCDLLCSNCHREKHDELRKEFWHSLEDSNP